MSDITAEYRTQNDEEKKNILHLHASAGLEILKESVMLVLYEEYLGT